MGVTEILSELVRINSINPQWGGPGEQEIATWLKSFFEKRNIDVSLHDVLPGRPNLIARVPGRTQNRRIIFEAHMDTVGSEEMAIAPFEPTIQDGRLYGRGSVDVKGGLAAMAHALTRIKNPPCDVILAAVIDEEHAYRGVLDLIDRYPTADAAIVAEPTQNQVVTANKGVLRWKIRTRGVAAHSAKPHLGESAILEMAKVLRLLAEDSSRLAKIKHPLVGSPTCCVGTIQGGSQVNIVPDSCVIELDRRMLPGEKAEKILSDYRSLLEGTNSELLSPDLSDEAMETSPKSEIVTTSMEVLSKMGKDSKPVGVPFGCDATKLSRAGIPSIIFGPGSIDQAHAATEFVELSQLDFAANFYEHVAMSFGSAR